MAYRHVPTKYPDKCGWALAHPEHSHGFDQCTSWSGCEKTCGRQRAVAAGRQRERRRQGVHPRAFPKPTGPNHHKAGYCSWCGDPVLKADGTQDTRRGWHNGRHGEPECLEAFFLHTRPDNQRAHLMRRDGPRCADCGQAKGQWHAMREVDPEKMRRADVYPAETYAGPFVTIIWSGDIQLEHEIPLWKVAHLPPDERAVYFGPANLRFRCRECHGIKTRREAAERAALRRAG